MNSREWEEQEANHHLYERRLEQFYRHREPSKEEIERALELSKEDEEQAQ